MSVRPDFRRAVVAGLVLMGCGPPSGPPRLPYAVSTPDDDLAPVRLTLVGIVVDAHGAQAVEWAGATECQDPECITYPPCPRPPKRYDSAFDDYWPVDAFVLDAGDAGAHDMAVVDAGAPDAGDAGPTDAAVTPDGASADLGVASRPLIREGPAGGLCWSDETPSEIPSHCHDAEGRWGESYFDCPTGTYADPTDDQTRCTCLGHYVLGAWGLRLSFPEGFTRLVAAGHIEIVGGHAVATETGQAVPAVVATWNGRPLRGELWVIEVVTQPRPGGDTATTISGTFELSNDEVRLERFLFGPELAL